nr:RNA polymerase sigma factor [uncultured Acetatifactor sp.]
MDERQWIHAIQKGDKRYLEDIAEKYYDDIFRFCAFQTGSREEAYDLAQETFLRFIRYVESYRDRNLKGYLLTIAMNVCRDYLRKRGVEERMTLGQADWERTADCGGPEAGRPRGGRAAEACTGQEKSRGGAEAGMGCGQGHGAGQGGICRDSDEAQRRERAGQKGVSPEPPADSDPEQRAVDADVHQRLMEALAKLPPMQREAILLHYLYDMKYREIGRLTEASVSTVKSRVRQGMDRLKGLLRREDFLD